MDKRTKFVLDEEEMPAQWYNILADLPEPLPPPIWRERLVGHRRRTHLAPRPAPAEGSGQSKGESAARHAREHPVSRHSALPACATREMH